TTFAVLVSFHYFSLESIIIFSQLKYASKVRFFGLTLGAHYKNECFFTLKNLATTTEVMICKAISSY
ncbi:hypothetical protein, partial [Listeria seeligeri]|uniref:hypothetical protein n=1 Tax=Listeria seeligeri TaxID=1640 RepID=UPI0022EA539F